MLIKSTHIVDTFAEAFRLRFVRIIVTAHDAYWLDAAVRSVCGYGTSVIGCDAEIGVERHLDMNDTPDRRPGAAILAFGFSPDGLGQAIANRTAQCLLTCPTASVFDGLPSAVERVPLGSHIRFFGDGFEKTKVVDARRLWRVPVMDGEFLVEESVGIEKGIGGGNFILQSGSLDSGLAAARRATDVIAGMANVIAPFPGGVVRSGSKVGSRYKALRASTNEAFCPSLVGRVETGLVKGAHCALEIVIDGINEQAVGDAMTSGIQAAIGPELLAVSAGNYGGTLGKFRFHLHQLLTTA
ncbi:MAG: formylmethanofuran--tetrahydromethanopterin N-formyltransferase [Planctomycetota bacterium]|nr:MAG: formylmethanofuran--tetrahydromethanopterin N-formyltransferase [Planctomycetota bacterium]